MTLNPSTERWSRAWIAAILVIAAWLRLQGLDWDEGQHLHPDERFLTMVGAAIKPPHSLAEYFDTGRSPLNPGNHHYGFFVYGTLPLFVVRWLGQWLGETGYTHIYLVGRVLSALCDCGTVWLTAWLGTRLAGRRVGLFACALAAFSVTSIQNAHFFTVDSAAAFFATAALCELVEVADTAAFRAQLVFGALFGATLGCRINLALLGDVYPLALLCAWRTRRAGVARLAAGAVAAGLAAALVFRVVQPYAFAGPGFFDLTIATNFLTSLREIQIFATGAADYPPAVQWVGRTPIVFAGKNLLLWGIGPAWGLAAVGGMLWWLVRRRSLRGAIALAWAVMLFGYHSVQFTATGRYFLPIVPVLAVFAAWPFGAEPRRSCLAAGCLVVALTASWALAFTSIYRRPTTRVEASRWIYQNVPADAVIATEHWDDGLPLDLADIAPVHYRSIQLQLYDDDTESKRRELVDQLASADYIAISSNRLYRSIPRTPWRYPLTRRYYELLFSGNLGFRLERSFTSYPRLGSFEIRDDGAEEAFTVYDHPHVLIFKKTEAFSREHVEELLGAAPLGTIHVTPRKASELYRRIRPTDIPLPESEALRTAVAARDVPSLGALLRWLATFATPAIPEPTKTPIERVPAETAGASAPPLGALREPRGLARAPDGSLYVADFGNRRIQHVSRDLRSLGGFGAQGGRPGEFRDPCGVAVGPDGSVYVADTWNHRIQKLSPKGKPLAEWRVGLHEPRGVALDRQGRIYVSDTGKNRVLRLGRDGAVERQWGATGDVLSRPVGIAVSGQGDVYVADTGHRRIAVFTADGTLLRAWPIHGWSADVLQEPYLQVGGDGSVWVTDPSGKRVLVFASDGRPLGSARASTSLSIPVGIALFDDTHAVVGDAGTQSLVLVSRTANTSVVPK